MRMERVCIIGAGPSGIAAAKNILDQGFENITIYDRGSEVGGNWVFDADSGHSSVFETTHIISSRQYSEYADYPMPPNFPDYPGHRHLAAYFQDYARYFGLYGFIEFRTLVESCEKTSGGNWRVTTRQGRKRTSRIFDYLVVCNGHHWKPRYPSYPGRFTGKFIHSHDFKRAKPFAGKRVLVIGAGNSACDVAVETSRVSESTDISMRRGYWIVPKFLFGVPADHLHNRSERLLGFVPYRWRIRMLQWLLKLMNGPNRKYGMQEPDHMLTETHPTLNSELLYFVRHGEITVRPDVERFEGRTVVFNDGSQRTYDAIVCCTGFEISHPFFTPDLIDYSSGPVPLYLRMFPAEHDNLAYVGLFQTLGCIWPAAELQAKILARRMAGLWNPPPDLAAEIQKEVQHPDVVQLDTPRHTITVDYPRFRARLLRELPPDYISREPARRNAGAKAVSPRNAVRPVRHRARASGR